MLRILLAFLLAATGLVEAASRYQRYALILEQPPLAVEVPVAKGSARMAAPDRARAIAAAQQGLRAVLAEKGLRVLGATSLLLNAVYVFAPEEATAALARLPGVARVEPMLPLRRHMIRGGELVRAPQGWSALGGAGNAGSGVKIAILDTGIDQEHPALVDNTLAMPPGYPRCRQPDCEFSSNKVIAVRSYVQSLVLGEEPEFSRPDDLSPRDRVGHGTAAAMVAAGARVDSPLGTVSGVAPKAYLGNYKIFGSPGVNDITFDDVVIQALEDAVNDGMDVAVLALGSPALWRPSDRGDTCALSGTEACDPRAEAVQNAVRRGLSVVVSAGNDGDIGLEAPTLNSIHSPGTAPAAITVGASTNSQYYFSSLTVEGAPASLQRVPAQLGDGPRPAGALSAPMRDVSTLEDNGYACSPLARGSLAGAIALIEQGDCNFSVKINHAQRAGAIAAVIYRRGGDFLFPMTQLQETGIPAALIGQTAGAELKRFLANNPARRVTLDPALRPMETDRDLIAYFSSYGPSIQDGEIKPEIVAPGRMLYMATQRFDPNGDMFSPNGWIAAQGTSFSAPMAAGAAALFKQRFPNATPAQVKSAVVNTATSEVLDFDASGRTFPASVVAVGAGKLNVEGAARTDVTIEPATLSFGILGGSTGLPSRGLRITSFASRPVNITLRVLPAGSQAEARLVLSESSFTLAAQASRQITVRLEGVVPRPGSYEGVVEVSGGAVRLRVPYLYLVGDGVGANMIPLRGFGFSGIADQRLPGGLAFKLIDRYGVPVRDAPVRFAPSSRIETALDKTDSLGIADARVWLGPEIGPQEFRAEAAGLTLYFDGVARLRPAIRANGVVNAASGAVGRGLAPGSYISIFGQALSEVTRAATTVPLPLSLAGVSVSFDRPASRLSLPGRIHFVSEGQINVQVPWELQGFNDVLMKVSIGDSSSALFNVPLNDYSPAFFVYTDPSSGRLFIAALDQQFRLVSSANPAARGSAVQLYANGFGPVSNQPASGEAAAAEPFSVCGVQPEVTVGGRPARVLFCGLAPGFVGLYQINVEIPADAPTGVQTVIATVQGVSSAAASLPIQ